MLKVITIFIVTVALVAGGTIAAVADTAPGNTTPDELPLDIADIEAMVAELGDTEDFEIVPAPLPGRSVSIDGGFRGVWCGDNAATDECPGILSGIYGKVEEPDGTGYGYFGGIWNTGNGEVGGYMQGRYADGYFWGTWRCLETGAGGILGGIYAPAPDASNDVPHHFIGLWITGDGQQTGYLKGTWSPAVQSQPAGRFAGQWTSGADETAAEVAPDGRLSGTHHVLRLADGSTVRYFKGRWSSNEGARGRIGGLVLDGRFYGLWNCRNSDAGGYLKGVWADHSFKGVWGHVGQEPGGRLRGRYGPVVTPEPAEAQPLSVQGVTATSVNPVDIQPVAVQKQAVQKVAVQNPAVASPR